LKETKLQNFYEVKIRHGKKVIAHTSCNFFNGEIRIRDLYVRKEFRGKGFGELLLARVLDYAVEQDAIRIVSYCGPEPFCEDGQIPLDQEVSWYKDHGFIHDHYVMGVTPCMIRELTQEVAQ
jgi:GNAT superfamily N-acetyltransferase